MATVQLVSMTEEQYQEFITWAIADYSQGQVKTGAWQPDLAVEQAKQQFDALLPEGLSTPNQYLRVIQAEGTIPVGYLWFGVREDGAGRSAVLYEFLILKNFRRRGYATQALLTLEECVREHGLHQIILHVFGHNAAARALYRKSGYVERNVTMVKKLGRVIGGTDQPAA